MVQSVFGYDAQQLSCRTSNTVPLKNKKSRKWLVKYVQQNHCVRTEPCSTFVWTGSFGGYSQRQHICDFHGFWSTFIFRTFWSRVDWPSEHKNFSFPNDTRNSQSDEIGESNDFLTCFCSLQLLPVPDTPVSVEWYNFKTFRFQQNRPAHCLGGATAGIPPEKLMLQSIYSPWFAESTMFQSIICWIWRNQALLRRFNHRISCVMMQYPSSYHETLP